MSGLLPIVSSRGDVAKVVVTPRLRSRIASALRDLERPRVHLFRPIRIIHLQRDREAVECLRQQNCVAVLFGRLDALIRGSLRGKRIAQSAVRLRSIIKISIRSLTKPANAPLHQAGGGLQA